jgi:rubrerythrin
MIEEIKKNLTGAFAAESKAQARNAAFALKAEQEGYGQLARLFRAAAAAKSIHARRYLFLMRGKIGGSEENVRAALEDELAGLENEYPSMVSAARQGSTAVKKAFVQSMKTNEEQAHSFKEALQDLLRGKETVFYVCQICGHIHTDVIPKNCPICKAVSGRFRKVI